MLRADYWKSHDRIYCDFCKCWYTDNKASKDFHENGKKHKNNVQKRISEIGRNAQKDAQREKKMEIDIRKMNDAALSAYMKDIAGGSDYSAKQITSRVAATSSALAASPMPMTGPKIGPKDPFAIPLPEDESIRQAKIAKIAQAKAESLWCEAKTEEGYIYYWNIKTGESIWEKPKEGFMTIKEYEEITKIGQEMAKQITESDFRDTLKNVDEIAAALKREQFKKIRVKSEEEDALDALKSQGQESSSTYVKDEKYGWENPETAARPIGKWQTVETRPAAAIDLQLPIQPESEPERYTAPVQAVPEPSLRRFKEKIITSIDSDEPGFFKKRKIARGNVRKQLSDD